MLRPGDKIRVRAAAFNLRADAPYWFLAWFCNRKNTCVPARLLPGKAKPCAAPLCYRFPATSYLKPGKLFDYDMDVPSARTLPRKKNEPVRLIAGMAKNANAHPGMNKSGSDFYDTISLEFYAEP